RHQVPSVVRNAGADVRIGSDENVLVEIRLSRSRVRHAAYEVAVGEDVLTDEDVLRIVGEETMFDEAAEDVLTDEDVLRIVGEETMFDEAAEDVRHRFVERTRFACVDQP